MEGEYPEKIRSKGDYSDWVAVLAGIVIRRLQTDYAEGVSSISESEIERAVKNEANSKLDELSQTQISKDILRFSETLQAGFIRGRMRVAEDTDKEATRLARRALYESVLEEVQFEIVRLSD